MTKALPVSGVDLWSDENLLDPFPAYRELRDLGPVVYLERYDLYAVTRYEDVKFVTANWQQFSSASGIAFNAPMNQSISGTLIGCDPPEHRRYRELLERPLVPRELKMIRGQIEDMARQAVSDLLAEDTAELMSGFARLLPVKVVAELVGLPSEGRDRMLEWASVSTNALAPLGVDRVEEGMAQLGRMDEYFGDDTLSLGLRPGSWADRLARSVEAGEIDRSEFKNLLQINYVLPALDTTVHAIGNLIWLLAKQPDVWARLRRDRKLVSRAINEAMRLEGPVQSFSRVTTCDVDVGGSVIPKGKRLLGSWASANRDERHYSDPDTFDLNRNSTDHFAFGHNEHLCLGRNLATMEIAALLSALLERVERISLVSEKRALHNALRGFSELTVAVRQEADA